MILSFNEECTPRVHDLLFTHQGLSHLNGGGPILGEWRMELLLLHG